MPGWNAPNPAIAASVAAIRAPTFRRNLFSDMGLRVEWLCMSRRLKSGIYGRFRVTQLIETSGLLPGFWTTPPDYSKNFRKVPQLIVAEK
jgi:hypothetical protein